MPFLRIVLFWTTTILLTCTAFQPIAPTKARALVRSTSAKISVVRPIPRLSPRFAKDDDNAAANDDGIAAAAPRDSLILNASRVVRRVSWLSWWSQVILSTVSAVTLLFAKSVVRSTDGTVDGIVLAGTGE